MSVRNEKKLKTRARLERAALDLFAEHGYDNTKVEEVAALAGVSARTAFRYFPAKSDLVFGDADADLAALRAELAAQDVSTPAFEASRAALVRFSARIDTPLTAERSRVVADNPALSARSLEIREQWAGAVAADLASRRGLDGPDERARLGGVLVVAILDAAIREWAIGGQALHGLREAVDRTVLWAADILRA